MAKLKVVETNEQHIQSRLGSMLDMKTIEGLSLQGMSPAMKQAGLQFVPDLFKAALFTALGETIFECIKCGAQNKIVTGQGHFPAQKWLLEQLAEWIPMIKTMNLHANIGRVSIPTHVLQDYSDMKVFEDIFDKLIDMGLSEQDVISIYRKRINARTAR